MNCLQSVPWHCKTWVYSLDPQRTSYSCLKWFCVSHRTFLENNDNSLFEKWKRILKNPLGPRQHRAPGPREHRAPGPHTCLVHLPTSVSNVSPTLSMDLVFHGSRRPRWGRGCFHVRLTPSVSGVHVYSYAYVLSEAILWTGAHTCTPRFLLPTPTTQGCWAYRLCCYIHL